MALRQAEEIIGDDRLIDLYLYWQSKLDGRRMAAREDIDPVEITVLLPNLMLVDVLEEGAQFQFRLFGTALTEAMGLDPAGRLLEDVLPSGAYSDYLVGLFKEIVNERRPLYSACEHHDEEGDEQRVLYLMLPLSEDDEAVNMVLAGQVIRGADETTAPRPVREVETFDEVARVLLR